MKRFIIVWYDKAERDFNNYTYDGATKSEAVKRFKEGHTENDVIVNIIDL